MRRLIRTHTERLSCRMTPDELRDRGEKLAAAEGRLRDFIAKEKSEKAKWKQEKEELDFEIRERAAHLRMKAEPRDMEVEVRESAERRNWVEEVRTDTGEVIRERSMQDDERQVDLLPIKGDA